MAVALDSHTPLFERVYAVCRLVPRGHVATYGQIAHVAGAPTPRLVGFALNALKHGAVDDVPWQRIVNGHGNVSPRREDSAASSQRALLEAEGVVFNADDSLCFSTYGWCGPSPDWVMGTGRDLSLFAHKKAGKEGPWINWLYEM